MNQSLSGDLWVKQMHKKGLYLINKCYRCGGIYLPLCAHHMMVDAKILPIIDYGGTPTTGLLAGDECKLHRVQNNMHEIYI